MKSLMEYKDYHARIEYDEEDHIFVGQVLGINDSLNFHGKSVDELVTAFQDSIENYLDLCSRIGKTPDKEFRGMFNVRIDPKMHKEASLEAANEGITLNQFVSDAIRDKLALAENAR